MRLTGRGRLLFVADDFGWRVEILLAAIVATHAEARIDRRMVRDAVGYAERNPVSVKHVLPKMVEVVFAEHDSAVLIIFPHLRISRAGTELAASSAKKF